MSKIFTRSFRVRYGELDANGWVSPASYLRYLVETAYDWGEANQLGVQVTQELGLSWVIRETEFEFFSPLRFGDEFGFTIWMVEWRRVRGIRSFEVQRKSDGVIAARGSQQIVSLDEETLRPVNLSEDVIGYFHLENPRVFPQQRFPKLTIPENGCFQTQRRVHWSDMDVLSHVNNAVYLDYVESGVREYLAGLGWSQARFRSEGLAPRTVRVHIQYQSPALWNEPLLTFIWSLERDQHQLRLGVSIKRADDGTEVAGAVLAMQGFHPDSGETAGWPEDLLSKIQ